MTITDELAGLVQPAKGTVSRQVYVSPEIYQHELERVFTRSWLCLGHTSQLRRPGDFVTTNMGEDPVIVARGKDGQVRAMLNSCRHRGMRVCRADEGNAGSFRCPYHAWTYSNTGELTGVPKLRLGYDGVLDRARWGLLTVPRVEEYGGFLFGNWDPEAVTLPEWLGDFRFYTDEYVQVARSLTRRAGLTEQMKFHQGSATALPFDDHSFDRICMLHVGMNIADKQILFAEIQRVLTADGAFGIYDVMRTGTGEVTYPVPWASTPATSFLAEPAHYRELLAKAGLSVALERDRREFGVTFFRQLRAMIAESGPPTLGLHIVMGQDAATKVANMIDNLERASIAPIEMICHPV